jgi:hypothetical protein
MEFEEAKQLAINGDKISLSGDGSENYRTVKIDNSGEIHYIVSAISNNGSRESFEINGDKLFNKKYNWIKYEAIP